MYSAWGGWKAWEEEGFDLLCLRLDLNTRVAEFQLACAVVLTWRMIYSKVWACLTTLTQRYVTLHQKPFFFPLLYKPYIYPPTSLEEANALHHVLLYIRRCVSARADSAHVVFTLACWAAGRLQVA